ncbi:hypothetical protein [Phenylobacterium sp.]|uniref:hypothetical protein n=1 Tax=Phenylobacterium sp. TaxID=1871053 RepID=UPI0027359613|nr:hypothetical protein [Phenylobacterium sp.]MDP3660868.1 hypothetical protein [Phenylobacterium sp.]
MDARTPRPAGAAAALAYRVTVGAGLAATLAANLPGHLSYDSVIALYEGRTAIRQTWAPAAYSWILGRFDALHAGTSLYVTASALLLYLSLMTLPSLRPRTSWLAAPVALAAMLTPQLLIYQGIVWKDVLFANLAVVGFIALAHAERGWVGRARIGPLAGALVCFALAGLVRQNGLVVVAVGAVALAWIARGGGWRASLVWGLGGFVAVCVVAVAFDAAVKPVKHVPKLRPEAAARVLQHYDVVGAAAHDPKLALTDMTPAAAAIVAADARSVYSAERIDTLGQSPRLGRALWRTPDAAMSRQWRDVVLHSPSAYLAHRLAVFDQVLETPALDRCLPVHVGVIGPPPMIAELGLVPEIDVRDQALAAYAARFFKTPVYSHLTWLLVAVAAGIVLLLRRAPGDMPMAAMLVGAVGFTASFFVLSVACDYRYLYALDLSAITALIYLALDPRPSRR